MRVVLDTNVFISGLVFGRRPREAVEFAILGLYDLIISEAILKELERILSGKFGWKPELVSLAIAAIRDSAEVVMPDFELTECADPDDNRILEAAVAGSADCIVTGDKRHLLRMRSFRGIEIITVDEFLNRLESATPERRDCPAVRPFHLSERHAGSEVNFSSRPKLAPTGTAPI